MGSEIPPLAAGPRSSPRGDIDYGALFEAIYQDLVSELKDNISLSGSSRRIGFVSENIS